MSDQTTTPTVSRRYFLGATAAAAILPQAIRAQQATPAQRRIKIGLIGAGGRGAWIAGLCKQHGGYDFHAVADYFPEVAQKAGAALGADPSRCFHQRHRAAVGGRLPRLHSRPRGRRPWHRNDHGTTAQGKPQTGTRSHRTESMTCKPQNTIIKPIP